MSSSNTAAAAPPQQQKTKKTEMNEDGKKKIHSNFTRTEQNERTIEPTNRTNRDVNVRLAVFFMHLI